MIICNCVVAGICRAFFGDAFRQALCLVRKPGRADNNYLQLCGCRYMPSLFFATHLGKRSVRYGSEAGRIIIICNCVVADICRAFFGDAFRQALCVVRKRGRADNNYLQLCGCR